MPYIIIYNIIFQTLHSLSIFTNFVKLKMYFSILYGSDHSFWTVTSHLDWHHWFMTKREDKKNTAGLRPAVDFYLSSAIASNY